MKSLLACLLLLTTAVAHAHGDHDQPSIVPQAERDRAQKEQASGPTENKGIESVKVLSTVPLKGEIAGADGYMLRTREITVAPGGVVAVHRHDGRPGTAYILEGEMVEYRDGDTKGVPHGVGTVAIERTGVTHWWENRGKVKARALVVDIVPAE